MIAFRKSHPTIARSPFYRDDIRWYGRGPNIDMSPESQHFAYYLDGHSQSDVGLYVMINAGQDDLTFEIQGTPANQWRRVVDTSQVSPIDIAEPGCETEVNTDPINVKSRSVIVLMRH